MKFPKKQVFYDDLIFQVLEKVYEPAEDSFLLADTLTQTVKENDKLLDIGTGSGILAVIAAKKAKKVVATDLNPHAIKCVRLNAETNHVASKIEVRSGDLFQPIQENEKFDLIVFNAPYLPTSRSEQRTWIGRAWAGGPTGRDLIDRFISKASNHLKTDGKILLVQSSLTGINETLRKFQEIGLEGQVIAEKKMTFETVVVIQANR